MRQHILIPGSNHSGITSHLVFNQCSNCRKAMRIPRLIKEFPGIVPPDALRSKYWVRVKFKFCQRM